MTEKPTYAELTARLHEMEEQVARYRQDIDLLTADHTRLQAILESAIHAIVVVNDRGQVIEWPSQAELLCGWSKSEMLGKPISRIMPQRIREIHQALIPEVLQGQHGAIFGKRIETTIINRDEFEVPVELAVTMTRVGDRPEITLFMHDITERKNYEAQLHHMSITDELTGLFNRRGFITLADKQLKMAQRCGKDAFMLYADFDNMKWINDTHGHPVGDSALVETAAILTNTFRQADLIGRVGGDEFIVLMNEPKDGKGEEVIMERLDSEISKANSRPDRNYQILLSTGTVRYNHSEPASIDKLMSQADLLMYENKKQKKAAGIENYRPEAHPSHSRKPKRD
ncbi:MAG: diguanylate cyclase [Desulfobulbaceae bacterium]|nr:diguanylate cyclase [Desulfobulbaceae bacterium]